MPLGCFSTMPLHMEFLHNRFASTQGHDTARYQEEIDSPECEIIKVTEY